MIFENKKRRLPAQECAESRPQAYIVSLIASAQEVERGKITPPRFRFINSWRIPMCRRFVLHASYVFFNGANIVKIWGNASSSVRLFLSLP